MRTSLIGLAVVGLLVAAARAQTTGTVSISNSGSADTLNQNVRVQTSNIDSLQGSISQTGTATDSLKQRVLVVAPAQTDTTGLSVSQTGSVAPGGTLQQQYVCAGGGTGCRGSENPAAYGTALQTAPGRRMMA